MNFLPRDKRYVAVAKQVSEGYTQSGSNPLQRRQNSNNSFLNFLRRFSL